MEVGLVEVLGWIWARLYCGRERVTTQKWGGRYTTAWLLQKKAFRWRTLNEVPP